MIGVIVIIAFVSFVLGFEIGARVFDRKSKEPA